MTAFVATIFGLIIGSFLNVCIYRWPRSQSVVRPRSHCPHCGSLIHWTDNIPVLSYCLLKGHWRSCQEKISTIYPIVECLNAVLWCYLFWRSEPDPETFKLAIFSSMMLVLIFTDLTEYILPNEITIGGLLIAFIFIPMVPISDEFLGIIWLFFEQPSRWLASTVEVTLSAIFIGGLLYGLRRAYFYMRKIEGLGLGDIKMMVMIATFWGLTPVITILMIGSIAGTIIGSVTILVTRKQWQHRLPFGSYLGGASVVVTIWGQYILDWYRAAVFYLSA